MSWKVTGLGRRAVLGRRRGVLGLEALEGRLVMAAPVAVNDAYTTLDGGLLNVAAPGVTANDSDAENDPFQSQVVANPTNGSLTLNPDGSFAYQPNAGFRGVDTFTYKLISQPQAISLTVNPAQSNVNVNATLRTVAGNDSDSDSSQVTGTMQLKLNPPTIPLGTAQISAANLVVAEQLRFDFGIGCVFGLCLVDITAQMAAGSMVITMPGPGAAGNVDGAGNFAQLANTMHVAGQANVSCSGVGCEQITIPANPQLFDDDFVTDLSGIATVNGAAVSLRVPLALVSTFDLGGGNFLDINMSGQVVATGTIASVEESNVATVTINSTDRIATRPETYVLKEDVGVVGEVPTVTQEDVILPAGSIWRYLDNGSDQGTAWQAGAFVDTTWAQGPAELGYGDGGEATVIDCGPGAAGICAPANTLNDNFITTYFRRRFNLEYVHDIHEVIVNLKRDDGAAVYINGTEVIRDGLPANAAFNVAATQAADDGLGFIAFTVPASVLVAGQNVIAVEVHQAGGGSSDVSFDLELKVRRANRGVLANDSNALNGPLLAELVRDAANGSVTVNPDGSFVYIPDPNFNGTDSFQYVASETLPATLVPRGATWRYRDHGSNEGTAWKEEAFVDAAWASGPAEFGYGDGGEATVIDCGPGAPGVCSPANGGTTNFITTYFRHKFNVVNAAVYTSDLTLNVIRDDGVAVYVNGVEVARNNLPAGAAFDTVATAAIGGADETTPVRFTVPRTLLHNGMNTLAVEIHQSGGGSSDVSFDAWLTSSPTSPPQTVTLIVEPVNDRPVATADGGFAANVGQTINVPAASGVLVNDGDPENNALTAALVGAPTRGTATLNPDGSFSYTATAAGADSFSYVATEANTFIAQGSYWRYLDNGSDQGTAWRDLSHNDATWAVGQAQLGYGDNDEATVVRFGPSASNKHITTYFRKTFEVESAAHVNSLVLGLVRDDGAVVYLNGVEIARDNLPAGPIAFNTLAPVSIGGVDESTPVTFTVDPALLVDGVNVIAVEMHQNAAGSSDLSFDLSLTGRLKSDVTSVSVLNTSTGVPQVQQVLLAGSSWSTGFLAAMNALGLGDGGFAIPGGADQTLPLPWSTANRVTMLFTEPVTNLPASLSLVGSRSGVIATDAPITAPGPGGTFLASWRLSGGAVFTANEVTLTLPDTVTSSGGTALDGEWTNGGDSYPSGNGAAGGGFVFRFRTLPGDVERDGDVDFRDVFVDMQNGFRRTPTATFDPRFDVTGDGIINMVDQARIRDFLGTVAPSPGAPGAQEEAIASTSSETLGATARRGERRVLRVSPTRPERGEPNRAAAVDHVLATGDGPGTIAGVKLRTRARTPAVRHDAGAVT